MNDDDLFPLHLFKIVMGVVFLVFVTLTIKDALKLYSEQDCKDGKPFVMNGEIYKCVKVRTK